MEETNQVEALLQRLEEHRLLYLDTYARVQDLLGQSGSPAPTPTASQFGAATLHPGSIDIPKSTSPSPGPPNSRRRRTITSQPDLARDVLSRKVPLATLPAASLSGETDLTSEHDDNEELYVQAPLETHDYDHEGLRDHLRSHKWTSDGRTILEGIVNNPTRMQAPTLFPIYPGPVEDLSHFSHHQVFDIGSDGAPLPVELPENEQGPSNAMTIWNTIRTLNPPTKERKAVGRIAIVREPSPMLFGAIHYTMNNSFYMDELFQHLTESGASCADFHRAFDEDERMQRSFVFNFEYFTIVGEEREPMEWQMAANQRERNSHHIAITRCSSVIALSLGGEPLKKIKNPSRRAKTTHGYAYDPFAPWKVLHLQCYPDWKASTDIHDSTKHYVNGVEAFMVSLLGEFRDCQKRFQEIYDRITKLITPPLDFMFNATIRDKLLFEDAHFTYSRRYFWAYQSLGIVNDSIKAIIDAYEDTFTPEVWEGKHGTLWPLLDQDSERNMYYKKKMASLKKKFEIEINNLRTRMSDNHKRRIEIRGLREELFTGTSIQESRKSVENTEITIQQGHNIKLLTLVSIFFLPLTFVTSVFGMVRNMTSNHARLSQPRIDIFAEQYRPARSLVHLRHRNRNRLRPLLRPNRLPQHNPRDVLLATTDPRRARPLQRVLRLGKSGRQEETQRPTG